MENLKIQNQIWTAENLNVSHYRNGDSIPNIQDPVEWENAKTGAWCYYANNIENIKFGKIYNSYAILDPRGLAPEGYRIPEHYDWLLFEKLTEKTKSTHNWQEYFKVQHAGYRDNNGLFYFLNEASGWWCKSKINDNENSTNAHFYEPGNDSLYWKPFRFGEGFYVRCIKNEYKLVEFIIDDNFNHSLQSVTIKYLPNSTFQEILDTIYNTFLHSTVSKYSYGREWCIVIFEDYMRLIEVYKSSNTDTTTFDQKTNLYGSILPQKYKLIIRKL
jgi:uncharacterized protein (TIGR02145 family)